MVLLISLLPAGIIFSAAVSLIYVTMGGLWADLWNDFIQFLIQIFAGTFLFISVVMHLGGISSIFTVWSKLPPSHSRSF